MGPVVISALTLTRAYNPVSRARPEAPALRGDGGGVAWPEDAVELSPEAQEAQSGGRTVVGPNASDEQSSTAGRGEAGDASAEAGVSESEQAEGPNNGGASVERVTD